MVSSTSNDSQRQRERRQFYVINQRDDVWQPFIWQHYVAPGPLPTNVEAHELSKRGRHTCEEFVDRLDHTLPELAHALRNLKKGLRERDLDRVLSANHKLRPMVTRVRVAEAALWPDHPLFPDWKQYSRRIRDDYNYYSNVGRAVETLAWGQALDDHLEVRRLHGDAIYCGPRLRDWGRQFWAQPLSLLRTRQERRAVERLRHNVNKIGARRGAPMNVAVTGALDSQQTGDDILLHRAQLQVENIYYDLSSPHMSLWSLLGHNGPLRHAVYQLRVTLQALNLNLGVLPARMSQFFLAGGDREENRSAWVRHVDLWWQCRVAQTPFNQYQVIHAMPPPAETSH